MAYPTSRADGEALLRAFENSSTIGMDELHTLARIGLDALYPSDEVREKVARAIAANKRAPDQQHRVDEVWPSYTGQADAALRSLTGAPRSETCAASAVSPPLEGKMKGKRCHKWHERLAYVVFMALPIFGAWWMGAVGAHAARYGYCPCSDGHVRPGGDDCEE